MFVQNEKMICMLFMTNKIELNVIEFNTCSTPRTMDFVHSWHFVPQTDAQAIRSQNKTV